MTAMDKDLFGTKFIIMPNPTDGHWIADIFGQSELEDSEANRAPVAQNCYKESVDRIESCPKTLQRSLR